MVRFTKVSNYKADKSCLNIQLCGSWLQEVGFPLGKRVVVEIEKEKITIKPVIEKN